MGRSKKVFGKSQKRPNGDIRSLLFKKKRTAEAALDALGAKLAAQKAQKAIDDKELARREDGAGNTYLLGIMMQENPKKALLDKIRLRKEEAAMLKRTLPARIIPMPPAEEMDTSPEPLRPPAPATYAVATKVLPRRQHIDWRRKHPREMAQAILYVHNFGGGAENVTKALAALQDDAVLNVDGIFDKLTRGTYTRWMKDWENYIGHIDDFCKPSEPVLSHQHQSPVYDSTKTKMREKLEQLGAAGATLNSTSIRPCWEAIVRAEQPGLLETFKMSTSWINKLCYLYLSLCGNQPWSA